MEEAAHLRNVAGDIANDPRGATHVRTLLGASAMLGIVATSLTIVGGLDEKLGYDNSTASTIVQTAGACIVLLAAYLVYGRYDRRNALCDLVVCVALALLGAASLVFAASSPLLATVPVGVPVSRFAVWAPPCLGLFPAAMLAIGALLPTRRVARPARALLLLGFAGLATAVGVPLAVSLLQDHLPAPAAESWAGLRVIGPGALLACRLTRSALFALAAVGFARQARRGRDELAAWLAGGCVLLTFVPFEYVLTAPVDASELRSDDVLIVAAYALILAGAAREIARYQLAAGQAAVDAERRRFARVLHDDLIQDVSFIALRARMAVNSGLDEPWVAEIVEVADRAVAASRSAIDVLSRTQRPLETVVARVADEAAAQTGIRTTVSVERGREPGVWAKEALAGIVREAIWNAVRHGGATHVDVDVRAGDDIRVVITDNGAGFDVDEALRHGLGYGLVSMRERVEELGGSLSVLSAPGSGTTVEAVVP
jgi:signal transduction histidine kinase